MRTLQRFATICFLGTSMAAALGACSSDTTDGGSAGAPSAGAPSAGAAGSGTAGSGTAGSGTAGSGTAGSGTAGSGTAGSGTAGSGTAGSGSAGMSGGLTGNATNGAIVFKKSTVGCATCHSENGEGNLGPNISGSKTAGIGNWTQAEFTATVRTAKNKQGMMLYLMAPYTASVVSDQEVADIYAFLMSKPNDTANAGSYCATGSCTGGK